MTPLGNRLLVEKIEEPTEVGGIILQQSSKQEPSVKCNVLAIGKDVEFCSIGDVIILSKYGGVEIESGLIVKEDEVLGIIEED